VSSGNRPSSEFAAMLLEVFFIPKTDLKTLSQDGIYTWYTFAREILAEFDIN
jgi:dTDP-4-dehydrorhamnose reductase